MTQFESLWIQSFITCYTIGVYLHSVHILHVIECHTKTDEKFNILDWWKVNSSRYRIFNKIARDILEIPMSTLLMSLHSVLVVEY